jgi:hypothetical protein
MPDTVKIVETIKSKSMVYINLRYEILRTKLRLWTCIYPEHIELMYAINHAIPISG